MFGARREVYYICTYNKNAHNRMDWKEELARIGADLPSPDQSEERPETNQATASLGTVTLSLDKRSRGKKATLIEGFTESDAEVARIAGVLKQRLGTGGSSRGADILIQGDRRSDAAAILREMGYKTKGA